MLDDVWDVAVGGRRVALAERGRERDRRRAGIPRGERGRAHLRRQHRLRPVRLGDDRARADGRAAAASPAQPRVRGGGALSGRDRPRARCSFARTPSRRGTRARGWRRCSCSSTCSTRASSRTSLPGARWARAATSLRSHISRCRSSARARRRWTDVGLRAPRRSRLRGSTPVTLAAKEGLSLINGTQFMTATAALLLVRARRLAATADIACAMSLEALQGSPTSFHPAIHAARPLPGQLASAENLRRLLAGSAIVESHRWCDKVQDAYSLRCAPQVHGASRDLIEHVARTVSVEVNAATDNPLVLLDEGEIVSNGNFHGQPIAMGLDCLAIAVRRARVDQRATDGAARQPVALGRAAAVPRRAGGGAQLGVHDPAVRRGGARLREQVVERIPPRSTRSRRARGRRITCRWGTPPG